MTAPLLTVDLGNTRCKLCLWDQGTPVRHGEFAADSGCVQAAHDWLAMAPTPAAAALSAVGDRELERELASLFESVCDGPVAAPPEHGLEFDVRSPETVGLDRLFAARGALQERGAAVIVVDAGTALTVDVATPGWFHGGAIAPGPALLAEALARGGARLPAIEPQPGAAALGKDTASALAAGVTVGFEGAARHLVERIAEESGHPHAPIVLTGGARGFIERALGWLDRERIVDEHLVQRGLFAAMQ